MLANGTACVCRWSAAKRILDVCGFNSALVRLQCMLAWGVAQKCRQDLGKTASTFSSFGTPMYGACFYTQFVHSRSLVMNAIMQCLGPGTA